MKSIKSVEEVRRRIAEPGFEEELIDEVRRRPTIWDRKSKYYNNRNMHDQEWRLIATALDIPKECCKAKWRNMRDVFMKELKKENSKWAHFNNLMFLKEVAVCKKPKEEELSDDDDRIREDVTSESSTAGSHFMDVTERLRAQSPEILARTWPDPTALPGTDVTSSEPSRKRLRSPTPDFNRQSSSVRFIEEEEVVRCEPEDEDMLFLRSLLPYFKHFSPVQKLRLRGKIENLIADEMGNFAS